MDLVKGQYKVLRIYEGGPDTEQDWHMINNAYGPNDISGIQDPTGASSNFEITSIPSPFARIHLFETAFRIVANEATGNLANLERDSIYNKLISDCFDVGEIFFKFDLFKQKYNSLKIIPWNKEDNIRKLLISSDPKHQLLGATLDLYIEQDGAISNFHDMENMYFITYDHKVIGGTSPSTLFFCTGNDLSFIRIVQGKDTFFDEHYFPLYKRDPIFQKYLYGLFTINPILRERMKNFWSYLLVNLKKLDRFNPKLYSEITSIISSNEYKIETFEKDYRKWPNNLSVEVLPKIYHYQKDESGINAGDFEIESKKFKGEKAPVVLQNGYDRKLDYFGRDWSSAIFVPYKDDSSINDRFVPGQDIKYPYLTVSDFLEPYLIKVPYPIDRENFFDGNLDGIFSGNTTTLEPPEDMFLIPLKTTFFEYFDISYLYQRTSDGKPVFRIMQKSLGTIGVQLYIPIKAKREYILFEREYYLDAYPDEEKNKGAIVLGRFNLALFPFRNLSEITKSNEANNSNEKIIGLIDTEVLFENDYRKESKYDLEFFEVVDDKCLALSTPTPVIRSDEAKNHDHNGTSKYYRLNNYFDFIKVKNQNGFEGLVIPKVNSIIPGKQQFTFAVDFGTTSTHIEYVVGNKGNPKSFDINFNERQLITLADSFWGIYNYPQLSELVLREIIPEEIGDKSSYRFPIRTATTEIEGLNHDRGLTPFCDISIPFYYQKMRKLPSEKFETNLKWKNISKKDSGRENKNRVETFIEEILILIKNKVLLNKGELSKTEIIWFYPASMSEKQISDYKFIWNNFYHKHFNDDLNKETKPISESIAPFYNFSANQVRSRIYPVVSIDIGGGTTDVVVYKDDLPLFLTSMKFGGNAVFGDGFDSQRMVKNGFVKVFSKSVETFLEPYKQQLNDLYRVYIETMEEADSVEIMNLFFSIDNNKDLEQEGLQFSVTEDLREHPKFGLVFILFYSAIIYHVAKIMKKLGFDLPRNICLSGNGSKIINLLDYSPKLKFITQYTKILFQKVYKVEDYHEEGLDILQGENPKKATCKGGIRLYQKGGNLIDKFNFDQIVLLGDRNDTIVSTTLNQLENTSKVKYEEILTDEHFADEVINEVENFIDLVYTIHEEYSFEKYFEISAKAMRSLRPEITRDLRDGLKQGIDQRMDFSDEFSYIEESLFFYPLISSLYKLGQVIADEDN